MKVQSRPIKKFLLLLLFFLAACQGIVPIHLTNGSSQEDRELVRDGVELLGLEVEFVSFEYGAANLELRDDCELSPDYDFEAFDCGTAEEVPYHRCHDLTAWAIRDPIIIGHEVGHLLGLDHVSDPKNLMFGVTMESNLTSKQMDDAHERAVLLNACR